MMMLFVIKMVICVWLSEVLWEPCIGEKFVIVHISGNNHDHVIWTCGGPCTTRVSNRIIIKLFTQDGIIGELIRH